MALYAALLYYPPDRHWTSPTEADTASGYADFFTSATAAGVLRGGEALHPADTAITISVDEAKGGEVMIHEGPHAEAEAQLGGFYVIEADELDEAIGWVAQIPAAWRGKVELRPIVPMSDHAT